jgi:hypothetical protein
VRRSRGITPPFLTPELHGDEKLVSRPTPHNRHERCEENFVPHALKRLLVCPARSIVTVVTTPSKLSWLQGLYVFKQVSSHFLTFFRVLRLMFCTQSDSMNYIDGQHR